MKWAKLVAIKRVKRWSGYSSQRSSELAGWHFLANFRNSNFEMAQKDSYESLKAENDRLRHTLLIVVSERKKMASQITGVQNLGVQLQKKDQELRTLSEKNERLESSLARAENRITQLSHLAGNNGQTVAGQGAIVTPGVSKKLLEALTRENTKLRQALDHLTNRGPGGVELAVVSVENLLYSVNFSLNIC